MTELKPEARAALECLRRELGGDEERERVRNRLATLGLVSASAGAIGLASTAAASVGTGAAVVSSVGASGAPPALAVLGASAQGASNVGAAAGATAAGAGASATASVVGSTGAASAGLAMAGGSLKAGTATTLVSSVTAKLVALPVALKASVVGVVLVSSAALPLSRPSTSVQRHERGVATPATHAAQRSSAHAMQRPANITTDVAASVVEKHESQDDAAAQPFLLAPPPVQPPSVSAVARTEALFPARRRPERATASTPAARAPAPELSALADEGALLERALRALRAGELEQTSSLLDEHERRHGQRAQLTRERERIRAELTQRTR